MKQKLVLSRCHFIDQNEKTQENDEKKIRKKKKMLNLENLKWIQDRVRDKNNKLSDNIHKSKKTFMGNMSGKKT